MSIHCQCCPGSIYCINRQAPMPSQLLQPAVPPNTYVQPTWTATMAMSYEPQAAYARPPETIQYATRDSSSPVNGSRSSYVNSPPHHMVTPPQHLMARSSWSHQEEFPPVPQSDNWATNTMNSSQPPTATTYSNDFDFIPAALPMPAIQPSPYLTHRSVLPPIEQREDHAYYRHQMMGLDQLMHPQRLSPSVSSTVSDGDQSTLAGSTSTSGSRRHAGAIRCDICHKTFERRSNYKSHLETHDKQRRRVPCKIEGCEKTFGRPAEMTRHVNSSHKQKAFNCEACRKDFTRNDILMRHRSSTCPELHEEIKSRRRRGRGQQ